MPAACRLQGDRKVPLNLGLLLSDNERRYGHLFRERPEQVDPGISFTPIAREHGGVGPVGGGMASVILHSTPQTMPPFHPRTCATKGVVFELSHQPRLKHGRTAAAMGDPVERRIHQECKHGAQQSGLRAPGIRAFAVTQRGEQVSAADSRGNGDAVAQPLPSTTMSG